MLRVGPPRGVDTAAGARLAAVAATSPDRDPSDVLVEALDDLRDLLVSVGEQRRADWLRTCRSLAARRDARGARRFVDGVTDAGGLGDLVIGVAHGHTLPPGADEQQVNDRLTSLVGTAFDAATVVLAAGEPG